VPATETAEMINLLSHLRGLGSMGIPLARGRLGLPPWEIGRAKPAKVKRADLTADCTTNADVSEELHPQPARSNRAHCSYPPEAQKIARRAMVPPEPPCQRSDH
jgi:hypothetical protein